MLRVSFSNNVILAKIGSNLALYCSTRLTYSLYRNDGIRI